MICIEKEREIEFPPQTAHQSLQRHERCCLRMSACAASSDKARSDSSAKVRERFTDFGLEQAEEKTRRMLFGRFSVLTGLKHRQGRPETLEFLGFKHVSGTDRAGRFALIRIPSVKSCRKFLARTRDWIFKNRHRKRWEQQQHLTKMLRGFYQYFALHHCERKLSGIRRQVQRHWLCAFKPPGSTTPAELGTP
ncbi:MAG: RNA-directed polymerase [Gammaproteobacteria bacterium]|nr:RNA-directed polymerase [Gammaproteobacteria bacterium]